MLNEVKLKLEREGYLIKFENNIIEYIQNQCKDNSYGARPIKRLIQNIIENKIADMILLKCIRKNEEINIYIEEDLLKIKQNKVAL